MAKPTEKKYRTTNWSAYNASLKSRGSLSIWLDKEIGWFAVETKMRCLKLLGERIMSRDFDRQVAELQVRAALLNRFTQLGTPVTVAAS